MTFKEKMGTRIYHASRLGWLSKAGLLMLHFSFSLLDCICTFFSFPIHVVTPPLPVLVRYHFNKGAGRLFRIILISNPGAGSNPG